MSGDEQLTILAAGVQARFEIPPRPQSAPQAIQAITTRTQKRRAKNAWNAACQLRLLIRLWAHFLVLGMLRSRLDDTTEEAIIRWFPELAAVGGVLNMLAQNVQWKPEVAQALPAFDHAHRMTRHPTERHREDRPQQFGARVVQQLVAAFRRLMATEAECLHQLEVNKDLFQQPWKLLRADVERLTCIDMDFTGDVPFLDFPKALRSEEFQRVRGRFTRELDELIRQLEAYPEAALERPSQQPTVGKRTARSRSNITAAEANQKVREYLTKRHEATSVEMAEAFGCSEAMVRSTPAWKLFSARRRKEKKGLGRQVHLDKALEDKAEEKHRAAKLEDHSEEEAPQGETQPSRKEQLKELIDQQERDRRADRRRPKRR